MEKSKNKYITIILIFIFILLLVGGAYAYKQLSKKVDAYELPNLKATDSKEDNDTANRMKAPDFLLYNDKGEEIEFSNLVGKPIVINFWATWCPYCIQEMADFNEIYKELKDEVHFMMINQTDGNRETKKKAQDYIAKEGFEFPVYYDLDLNAARAYGITSLPTTVFVDKDGYFFKGYLGALSKSVVEEHIDLLLDK